MKKHKNLQLDQIVNQKEIKLFIKDKKIKMHRYVNKYKNV